MPWSMPVARTWSVTQTSVMRTKEYAHDYRYFPEPDLMPVLVSDAMIAEIRGRLPELPEAKRQRFVRQYGLPEYDAGLLVATAALAEFYEKAVAGSRNPKAISNWMMSVSDITATVIQPAHVGELVAAIEALADQAIAANPKSVADYKAGNEAALNHLKGQVMKLSKGKANPQLAGEILVRKLRN